MRLESISTFMKQADKVCDYIPIVSSVSNLTDIFQKCVVFPLLKDSNSNFATNHYCAHLKDKSFARCLILLIPVFGNLTVAIFDFFKAREKSKQALSDNFNEAQEPQALTVNAYSILANKALKTAFKELKPDSENSKAEFRANVIAKDIRAVSEVRLEETNKRINGVLAEGNLPTKAIISNALELDIARTGFIGLNGKILSRKGAQPNDPLVVYHADNPSSKVLIYRKIFEALQTTADIAPLSSLSAEQELFMRRSFMNLSMLITQGNSVEQVKIVQEEILKNPSISSLGVFIEGKGALIDMAIDKDRVSITIINSTKISSLQFTEEEETKKNGSFPPVTLGYFAHKATYTISREDLGQKLTTIDLNQLKELLPASIRDKDVSSMTSDEVDLLFKYEAALFQLEAAPLNSKRVEEIRKQKQTLTTAGSFTLEGETIAKAFNDTFNTSFEGHIPAMTTTLNLANIFPSLTVSQSFSEMYPTKNEALAAAGLKDSCFPSEDS